MQPPVFRTTYTKTDGEFSSSTQHDFINIQPTPLPPPKDVPQLMVFSRDNIEHHKEKQFVADLKIDLMKLQPPPPPPLPTGLAGPRPPNLSSEIIPVYPAFQTQQPRPSSEEQAQSLHVQSHTQQAQTHPTPMSSPRISQLNALFDPEQHSAGMAIPVPGHVAVFPKNVPLAQGPPPTYRNPIDRSGAYALGLSLRVALKDLGESEGGKKKIVYVHHIFEIGIAAKSGAILAGDCLKKVNGHDAIGSPLESVMEWLKGRPGTVVGFEILRPTPKGMKTLHVQLSRGGSEDVRIAQIQEELIKAREYSVALQSQLQKYQLQHLEEEKQLDALRETLERWRDSSLKQIRDADELARHFREEAEQYRIKAEQAQMAPKGYSMEWIQMLEQRVSHEAEKRAIAERRNAALQEEIRRLRQWLDDRNSPAPVRSGASSPAPMQSPYNSNRSLFEGNFNYGNNTGFVKNGSFQNIMNGGPPFNNNVLHLNNNGQRSGSNSPTPFVSTPRNVSPMHSSRTISRSPSMMHAPAPVYNLKNFNLSRQSSGFTNDWIKENTTLL